MSKCPCDCHTPGYSVYCDCWDVLGRHKEVIVTRRIMAQTKLKQAEGTPAKGGENTSERNKL